MYIPLQVNWKFVRKKSQKKSQKGQGSVVKNKLNRLSVYYPKNVLLIRILSLSKWDKLESFSHFFLFK